jgi:hypothetical protein
MVSSFDCFSLFFKLTFLLLLLLILRRLVDDCERVVAPGDVRWKKEKERAQYKIYRLLRS